MTMQTCPVCLGLRGLSAPICSNIDALYTHVASKVIGRRVSVVEVECVATGAPYCKYAFNK